ncbi:M48 family metalloprotease [Vulcaniibacterium gelatinicum]|uniref:M48 family metalloprotease n=1 Tax=Vulcaniibacterium gelatinicum TaxID=2598725 RepID=UPI0011C8B001
MLPASAPFVRSDPLRRSLPLAAALAFAAALSAPAQEPRLPDIGSSAGEVLPPARQAEYGAMLLSQLRHYDYVLEDPLLEDWLQGVGQRLAASSDQPRRDFTFFLLKEREINAFATLGGYIGMNAGLILAAEREDQVASVLAHEIAHVTQDHVLRAVERAQRERIPILLATIAAIAVAQGAASENSQDDAALAAAAIGQGLMVQRQIDYTRSNEAEADRIGIQNLARAGYDPHAAAEFFSTLQAAVRVNRGGERERVPDYLQTHPVTTLRISEARERAARLQGQSGFSVGTNASDNPLLPSGLRLPGSAALARGGSGQFGWARERLRVLSANTPAQAIREYEAMREKGPLDDARRYGLAVARLRAGQAGAAAEDLAALLARHPGDLWLTLALAEAEARAGRSEAADRRFETLLARMPDNRAAALTYAQVLAERGNAEAGRRAQTVLRPLATTGAAQDPLYQRTLARVSELAGDPVRAGEAWAEAEFLNGRPERALVQLETLKKRQDLDYYARARIEARIAAITPTVLELRRQGIRDEELRRR